ncbi:MAG: glycosyltransferase [Candidatus Omnitrophota bacterium]|nr:glycosyltransferase [Candidatus Omnitrophota bacterium]
MDAHIVILNYNGVDILKEYLPLVVKEAGNSSHNVKVTVLDNKSSDNSVAFIKENFPSVNVVVAKVNRIVASYNDFLGTIPEKIILLLNNDAYMAPGCIDRLIERLNDDKVFVAAPKILDKEGVNITGGCMDFSVRTGLFRNKLKNMNKNDYTFFVGSTAAYDREKFMALGGYDPIYLPGTYEDMDLCYRAWQRGWLCVYEESAVAYHEDSASFKKVYGERRRQKMAARNAYLFVWKNIHDPAILFSNIFLYPLLIIYNVLRMRSDLVAGSLWALSMLPRVIRRRRDVLRAIAVSDKKIRQIFEAEK